MIRKIKLRKIDFEFFINAEYPDYEKNTISIINNNNRDYNNNKFIKELPDTYCWENVKMKQKFWQSDELDYKELGRNLNMDVKSVGATLQPPGSILPIHVDSFFQLRKKFPNSEKSPVRANIFLQDWKIGHFLQFENETISHWKAGEGFIWDSTVYHLSANAGIQNKYTLQVSGFLND